MGWIAAETRRAGRGGIGAGARPSRCASCSPGPGQRVEFRVLVVQDGTELERHPETGPIELGAGGGHAWLTISSRILKEARVFPPPESFAQAAHVKSLDEYRGLYERSLARSRGLLGRAGGDAALVEEVGPRPRLEAAVREVVRGRHAQPLRELPRPPRHHLAQEQGGHHLGRASRARRARSPTRSCCARCAASRTCSRPSASRKGDRVGIYMPMIPEAAVAMLACARIGATHSVVFGGFSAEARARPHERRRGQADHHRRRRLSPRQRRAAQGQRGRRAHGHADRPARGRRAPHRARPVADARRARPLVARADGGGLAGLPGRAARRRAPALHPLHERHHRQAEGRGPHHRRLPAAGGAHHEVRLRPEGRGHATGARPTSAG